MATRFTSEKSVILLSEDHWISNLYPGEISTIEDYVRCSNRLRDAIAPHIISLLQTGASVVMDFPANTLEQRKWLRSLFETAQADHQLHFLDLSDAICKERLHTRNAKGDHAFQVSDEQFDLFTSYFVPPKPEEEFNLIVHQEDSSTP